MWRAPFYSQMVAKIIPSAAKANKSGQKVTETKLGFPFTLYLFDSGGKRVPNWNTVCWKKYVSSKSLCDSAVAEWKSHLVSGGILQMFCCYLFTIKRVKNLNAASFMSSVGPLEDGLGGGERRPCWGRWEEKVTSFWAELPSCAPRTAGLFFFLITKKNVIALHLQKIQKHLEIKDIYLIKTWFKKNELSPRLPTIKRMLKAMSKVYDACNHTDILIFLTVICSCKIRHGN